MSAERWVKQARTNLATLGTDAKNAKEDDVVVGVVVPLLAAVGFDPFDAKRARYEFTVREAGKTGDGAADVALFDRGKPTLLVETKRPGGDLDAAVKQVSIYLNALNSRPRFGVATDGKRWRVYDHKASGTPTERVILELDATDDEGLRLLAALLPEHRSALREFADAHRKYVHKGLEPDEVKTLMDDRRRKLASTLPPLIAARSEPPLRTGHPTPTAHAVPKRPDYTKKNLAGATLYGEELECRTSFFKSFKSWKGMLVDVARYILRERGELRENFRPRGKGMTARSAKEADAMWPHDSEKRTYTLGGRTLVYTWAYTQVTDDLFLYTNLSSDECVKFADHLLAENGFDPCELVIEAR